MAADDAPVSRSAPPPQSSRLNYITTTSFGSQPDIEMTSRSPPLHHRQQQQQQGRRRRERQHGGRCRQASTTTAFYFNDDDDVWRDSGDRRLVVAPPPPPYSRDERIHSDDASPIRLLFSTDDDGPSPPVPSPCAVARAAAVRRSPPRSPHSPRRVDALRRQAVSDNAVSTAAARGGRH